MLAGRVAGTAGFAELSGLGKLAIVRLPLLMPDLITPRYRPSIERQTRLYWSLRRLNAVHAGRRTAPKPARNPIPSNSVPWLPHPARSIAELMGVMTEMEKHASAWGIELKSL